MGLLLLLRKIRRDPPLQKLEFDTGIPKETIRKFLNNNRPILLGILSKIVAFRETEEIIERTPAQFKRDLPGCYFIIDGLERGVFKSSNGTIRKLTYNDYYSREGVHCVVVQTPDRMIAGLTPMYVGSATEFKHIYEGSRLPEIFASYCAKRPPSLVSLLQNDADLKTIQQERKKLYDSKELHGVCLADGAFKYAMVAVDQMIITPQQLPRSGDAQTLEGSTLAVKVAHHRAPVEHMVKRLQEFAINTKLFHTSQIAAHTEYMMVSAAIINLNQMVRLHWTPEQIEHDIGRYCIFVLSYSWIIVLLVNFIWIHWIPNCNMFQMNVYYKHILQQTPKSTRNTSGLS
jgi:hypothetical protein